MAKDLYEIDDPKAIVQEIELTGGTFVLALFPKRTHLEIRLQTVMEKNKKHHVVMAQPEQLDELLKHLIDFASFLPAYDGDDDEDNGSINQKML